MRSGWRLMQEKGGQEHCQEVCLRYAVLRAGHPGHELRWREVPDLRLWCRSLGAIFVGIHGIGSCLGPFSGAWHASSLRLPTVHSDRSVFCA